MTVTGSFCDRLSVTCGPPCGSSPVGFALPPHDPRSDPSTRWRSGIDRSLLLRPQRAAGCRTGECGCQYHSIPPSRLRLIHAWPNRRRGSHRPASSRASGTHREHGHADRRCDRHPAQHRLPAARLGRPKLPSGEVRNHYPHQLASKVAMTPVQATEELSVAP